MRRTVLERNGTNRVIIETGDLGTRILDEFDAIIRESFQDRHDEYVEEYTRGGWIIVTE